MYPKWHTLQHLRIFQYKESRIGVWCKTEQLANEFLKILEKDGIRWCDNTRIFNSPWYRWSSYADGTYFLFENGLMFGDVNSSGKNYNIFEFCG